MTCDKVCPHTGQVHPVRPLPAARVGMFPRAAVPGGPLLPTHTRTRPGRVHHLHLRLSHPSTELCRRRAHKGGLFTDPPENCHLTGKKLPKT